MDNKNELQKETSSPENKEEIFVVQSNMIQQDISNDEKESEIDEADLQKKKLDEIEQSISKQKTKKSKILNIVFFIVNMLVVVGILTYQLLNEDFIPLTGITFDWPYLIVIMLLLGSTVLVETMIFSYLMKQNTGKFRFATSYKVGQIGRYYDSITPMATGGQPFQISYLKSRGVPIHTSLSMPVTKYVFGQIAWVLISFICLVISWTNKSYGTFVSVTSFVGFILGSLLLFLVFFLSVCKTVGNKLVVKTLKLLHKMKIVKNYDKQYEKITKLVSDFQDVMKQYAKSPKDFIILSIFSILKNVFNYMIPFFIIKFFGIETDPGDFIKLFVLTNLVELSASFFPLPGGTGMNEISFKTAFDAFVASSASGSAEGILVWVLLIWRFCSYYFYLIQGICILSYDMAYGNRKYRWVVKRDNLAEESAVFKQEQINRFRADRAKRRKNKNKSDKKEYL